MKRDLTVIGVISGVDAQRRWYGCKAAYIDAITAAGGLPLIVPYTLSERIPEILTFVDGLVLTGGDDAIDPLRFGQALHPEGGQVNAARDEFEMSLVHGAIEEDIPVLGICRGMQVLNVALGGSLCQHLAQERPGTFDHHQAVLIREAVHQVRISAGTKLAAIADHQLDQAVNSSHYQGIDEVAPCVLPSAVAPDGTIEAIEAPDSSFVVGVQWHPEELAAHNPFAQRLFSDFVRTARDPYVRGERLTPRA